MNGFSKPALRLLAAAIMACAVPAYAAEEAAPQQPDNLTQTESAAASLTPELEGIGLYKDAGDGSLGTDIWKGSSRADIVALIESMPASSKNHAMQRMIYGVLLSQTNTDLLEKNDTPAPGKDLLSLRLAKLIEGGAYLQALELYTLLPEGLDVPDIAQAGVLAMLANNDPSLACLEIKTFGDRFTSSDFLKTASAWCDAVLSPAPTAESLATLQQSAYPMLHTLASNKNFMFTYTPETFGKLSRLEQTALVAMNKLDIPERGARDYRDVPAAHIQLLLKNAALNERDKFILRTRALEWGLMGVRDIEKIYVAAIDPDDRLDPALAPPANAEDWQKIPYALQIAKNKTTDSEKWAAIASVLPAGEKYGLAALTPFADMLYRLKPEKWSINDVLSVARILNLSGRPISDQVVDSIDKIEEKGADPDSLKRLRAATYVSRSAADRTADAKAKITGESEKTASIHDFFLKTLIETLDNQGKSINNASTTYENFKDLTLSDDYAKPDGNVWKRLGKAANSGHVGETVTLSAVAIRDAEMDQIFPPLFVDVLRSLKTVGLTDISEDMAVGAVLGN